MSSNVQGAAQRGTPSDSQEHERAGHTSLYERAFGRGSAEFPADCMSAPLYEHGGGGSMDEQDAEEMLYQRSLVMEHYRKATAQDHAWSAPAFPQRERARARTCAARAHAWHARTRAALVFCFCVCQAETGAVRAQFRIQCADGWQALPLRSAGVCNAPANAPARDHGARRREPTLDGRRVRHGAQARGVRV